MDYVLVWWWLSISLYFFLCGNGLLVVSLLFSIDVHIFVSWKIFFQATCRSCIFLAVKLCPHVGFIEHMTVKPNVSSSTRSTRSKHQNSVRGSTRSKQQRQAAARPNSVLVAPFRVALQTYSVAPFGVARPKGSATPPSQKCSPYWAWAHNGAAEGICRANTTGATSLLCRAIVSPSPVGTAFLTWWRGRSLWSRHY